MSIKELIVNVRPKSIIILSMIFLLSPPVIIIQGAVMNLVPVVGPGNIFLRLSLSDILVLCLYPVCAVSIFSVRKWGWRLFIISSLLLIARNAAVFFLNPFSGFSSLLIYTIILTSTALFFFRKHLIAPYFNPRLRIWEQSERFEISIFAEICETGMVGELADISFGGCFIRTASSGLSINKKYRVCITWQEIVISAAVRVMRISRKGEESTGYGLMFSGLSEEEKRKLIEFLAILHDAGLSEKGVSGKTADKREHFRYCSDFNTRISVPDGTIFLSLENISLTGCCARTADSLEKGAVYDFSCGAKDAVFSCASEIMWIGKRNHGFRYGLLFRDINREKRRKIRKILKIIKKIHGKKQKREKSVLERIVDETLPKTPYRYVASLKGFIKNGIRKIFGHGK